jgi:small-conductance mechanosensitive channel
MAPLAQILTMTSTWLQLILKAFEQLWMDVIGFLPTLVIAFVILLVGWFIGAGIGRIVTHLMQALKVDNALRNAGIEEAVSRGGYALNSGAFLGALVKWFVFAVFLVAALDILQLEQVNTFLRDVVLGYVPQVIVAVLILLLAAVIADVVKNIVVGAAKAAHLASAHFLDTVVTAAIWIFAILAALNQLGVAQAFVQTLFTGIVIAVSLAVGLAFGLGGQDAAARAIESTRERLTRKES